MDNSEAKAHQQEPGLPASAQCHGTTAIDEAPIVSRFIDDEIYRPLLIEFVADLPGHISEIRAAADAGLLQEACRLSHRLKGAAATYGFPELAGVAAVIEDTVLAANKSGATVEPVRIVEMAERMSVVTHRIELGAKQWNPTAPMQ